LVDYKKTELITIARRAGIAGWAQRSPSGHLLPRRRLAGAAERPQITDTKRPMPSAGRSPSTGRHRDRKLNEALK